MRFFKRKVRTIDFTKLPDARIKEMPGEINIAGDCVDLRSADLNEVNNSRFNSSSVGSGSVGVSPPLAPSLVGTPAGAGGGDSVMDFLGGGGTTTSSASSSVGSGSLSSSSNDIVELKRMIRATSNKADEASNEVYRLIQKIELLERKIERLESRG